MQRTVRVATDADVPTLVRFNIGCALDSEGKHLDPAILESGVRRGMAHGNDVLYFLAEEAGEPIGQLMLTREWSDWRDGWIAWIQSVYVRTESRGTGVFRSLLNAAVADLKQRPDYIGIRLYVENGNDSAAAVYLKTGFTDPKYRVLEMMFQK